MKILFVVTGFEKGGAELFLLRLLRQFRREESLKFGVLGLRDGPLSPEFRDISDEIYILKKNWRSLLKAVISGEYELFQGWMYHGDLLASLLGIIFGLPWMASIRNGSFSEEELQKRRCFFLIYRHTAKTAYGVISCSRVALDWHRSHLNLLYQRVFIISNGYDSLAPKTHTKDNDLILVGRNHPQKNYSKAIEIIEKVVAIRPNIRAIIVGKGVTKLRVSNDCILLLEHNDDVRELMGRSRLLLSFSHYGEAFPNVLIESIMESTPFLSYSTGEAPLLASYGGEIMEENKEVNHIVRALKKPPRVLVSQAKKQFNIETISKEYLNTYQRCVESAGK